MGYSLRLSQLPRGATSALKVSCLFPVPKSVPQGHQPDVGSSAFSQKETRSLRTGTSTRSIPDLSNPSGIFSYLVSLF